MVVSKSEHGTLNIHIESVEDEFILSYKCSFCPYTTKEKPSLSEHQEEEHKNEDEVLDNVLELPDDESEWIFRNIWKNISKGVAPTVMFVEGILERITLKCM